MKRLLDIFMTLCILLPLSPFFLIIGAAVKLSSPGTIFFGSERLGYRGKRFRMWKFKTMYIEGDKMLNEAEKAEFRENFKLKHDPRITGIGRILRNYSLDELPQLWNVLTGEMSLVGPRPKLPEEIHLYGEKADKLLSVRPGLTGYWQVHRISSASDENIRKMDMYYIDNKSILLDLKLLAKTAVIVFKGGND